MEEMKIWLKDIAQHQGRKKHEDPQRVHTER